MEQNNKGSTVHNCHKLSLKIGDTFIDAVQRCWGGGEAPCLRQSHLTFTQNHDSQTAVFVVKCLGHTDVLLL